ncbi:MAG: energy-coupling factor transporter ATPase [Clostridia bacterium]|nr:energy-coupling factor transporter ATPase [Clostridia bacterium]
MEAIKFEKVYFSYEDGEETDDELFGNRPTFSLDGIDLTVQEGEFVAVLGHNGSGKSTLARLTNGLLEPQSGKITVLGIDTGADKNIFEVRKNVGIVFQNPDNQTVASIVEDDVAFGPENIGMPRKEIGERIDFALNAVGMQEYRYATTTRLSGGQKQRIAIAGVLALKPKIMILDESTAMLDPRGRKEVLDVVCKLNKEEGITVLLITHFPEEAMLADRALVMDHGKIVMEGEPQEILAREAELEKYSLTLPRSLKICRALQNGGLDIADSYSVEEIAESIAEKVKKTGAGTQPTTSENREELRWCEDGRGEIVCENLSYTYNEKSAFATHALCGVDLHIPTGAFYGIIGHTGSGKSTFVQHLNALIKLPTAEKKYKEKKNKKNASTVASTVLKVNGYDLSDKKTDFLALRRSVGMVFQYPEYQLFAESVYEDVAFGLKNFRKEMTEAEVTDAVREALETVGLSYEEVKNRSPFELSGGQRRRVAIAGVIVTKPEILVLDEPAAGLDPLGKEDVMKLLHKIHADWCKTVIIVSHDMDEISENCTGAAIFSEGKVLAARSPKELFQDGEYTQKAGLDLPFTAKLVNALKNRGVEIDCDLTTADFVAKILAICGNGADSAKGGGYDA